MTLESEIKDLWARKQDGLTAAGALDAAAWLAGRGAGDYDFTELLE